MTVFCIEVVRHIGLGTARDFDVHMLSLSGQGDENDDRMATVVIEC